MKVKEFESEGAKELWIPTREDNQPYKIAFLYKDQKAIVSTILATLDQWLNGDDMSSFQPLRMTVNGSGGSGKSVIINTVVAVMRKMFGMNDVVKVAAPTGTAAFNVGGETFHHMLGNAVSFAQYRPNTMQQKKRLHLIQKFKTLLCLIIDERSLINSSDLGTTERMIAETIYGGGNSSDRSFGGLPIVILFGDDYQLPGGEEGGLAALFNRGGEDDSGGPACFAGVCRMCYGTEGVQAHEAETKKTEGALEQTAYRRPHDPGGCEEASFFTP